MFTPNSKTMKIDFTVEPEDYIESGVLCWSPILNTEVWLPSDVITDDYDMETTKEKPKPYTGTGSLTQDWMILKNKNGDEKQIFWTCADQFQAESCENLSFTKNDLGLDIDPEKLVFDYNDNLSYSDEDDNNFMVGSVTDLNLGKLELYSAIESNDSTDEDEDGDEIYATIPQERFEAIRQLCIQSGFKVKVKRTRR